MAGRPLGIVAFGMSVALVVGCQSPHRTVAEAPTEPSLAMPEPAAPEPATPALAAPEPAQPLTPTTAEPSAPATAEPSVAPRETPITLPGGIVVDRAARRVTLPARIATRTGFLEAVACGRDSREHESLLVLDVKASALHAALILLGAEPGRPGRWRVQDGVVVREAPQGSPLRVLVEVAGAAGSPPTELAITDWIRGADGRAFDAVWVFAGSRFADNPRSWKEPGQHYVADFTGSIVGLVTFGDEAIAATSVISDLVDIEAANWEAWTERMPPEDTPVRLVLERPEAPRGSLAEPNPSSR
jgi:hypothetical protein